MSKIDTYISKIKTEYIGETSKKVLVVEGEDDVAVFRSFLSKQNAGWERQWVVVPAHGKSKVIEIVDKELDWLGVIDKDEWVDHDVESAAQQYENLYVLPRFCIESYLIDPDEIWVALPEKQRAKMPNGKNDLTEAIRESLDVWIRHAALWQVINPLYQRMRKSNHRGSILDEPLTVPDQARLKEVLQTWLDGLNPDEIANQVDVMESRYRALPQNELFSRHLYAKKFYPMVVHNTLNQLLGQKSERERVLALLRTLALPDDLAPLWQRMALVHA